MDPSHTLEGGDYWAVIDYPFQSIPDTNHLQVPEESKEQHAAPRTSPRRQLGRPTPQSSFSDNGEFRGRRTARNIELTVESEHRSTYPYSDKFEEARTFHNEESFRVSDCAPSSALDRNEANSIDRPDGIQICVPDLQIEPPISPSETNSRDQEQRASAAMSDQA